MTFTTSNHILLRHEQCLS